MNTAPTLTTVDGLITVTAGYTPTTHIRDIDSIYSRQSGREGVSHEDE